MKKMFSLLLLILVPSLLMGWSSKKDNSEPDRYLDIKYSGEYALVDNYFDIQSCQKPTGTLKINAYLINNTNEPIKFFDITKL